MPIAQQTHQLKDFSNLLHQAVESTQYSSSNWRNLLKANKLVASVNRRVTYHD